MAIKPEEEKYNKIIRELEEDRVRYEEKIKVEKLNQVKNERDLEDSQKHNKQLDNELNLIEDEVNKIRDDPSRYE
jgi:succinate dehydrogenase/fumarate reductase flavoprotein subunit